jgi:hypothetical protein
MERYVKSKSIRLQTDFRTSDTKTNIFSVVEMNSPPPPNQIKKGKGILQILCTVFSNWTKSGNPVVPNKTNCSE